MCSILALVIVIVYVNVYLQFVFLYLAVAPVFTNLQAMQESAEVSLSVGDSVRLRCDAVGRPRVEVQWFKGNKMLSASGPASTSSSSSSSSSSSLDYYYYDHPYAPNGGGGTSSRSRRVRHAYSQRHDRAHRRRRRSENRVDEITGSTSRLRSAGDLELDRTDEFYVGDGNERLSLMLDSVTSDDAGLYTCRAFNKAGTVNFTYAVHITGMTSYHVTHVTTSGLLLSRFSDIVNRSYYGCILVRV